MTPPYRVWIDQGGTFTDFLVFEPSGAIRVTKLVNRDLDLDRAISELLGGDAKVELRMGTTVATNALLERQGVRTALITNAGFGDLLALDDQTRPALFSLRIERPTPLVDEVVEVSGRVSAEGETLAPLDPSEAQRLFQRLRDDGIQALAVALIHAHRFPAMENTLRQWAHDAGFAEVVCSHEVSAAEGLLARAQTAVLDAYLTPVLRRHLDPLTRSFPEVALMQSSGDLVRPRAFKARNALLSGPAGGAVACAFLGERYGLDEVIGFDMGGTSTDVSRWGGHFDRMREARVAGLRVRAPMIAIHTVAAGGGSLCRFDGQQLTVGPKSAGARPGPLCYGDPAAREVALTDAAVVLGRIPSERFPFSLHEDRAREGIKALAQAAGLSIEGAAEGLFEIAAEQMASAIAEVTVAKGYDARTHTMVVFGGAGGQYACRIAQRLGVGRCLVHPWAGVLSAFGIGAATLGRHVEVPLLAPLSDDALEVAERHIDASTGGAHTRAWLSLRHEGTEATLEVPFSADLAEVRSAFHELHRQRFGYTRPDVAVELTEVRIHAYDDAEVPPLPTVACRGGDAEDHLLYVRGAWVKAKRWHREDLPIDTEVPGPLVVLDDTSTVVVDPGWTVERDSHDVLHLRRTGVGAEENADETTDESVDPIRLQVLAHHFMAIADRMGVVLQRTAVSTNIRDRRDFSCALFDPSGRLIANAPHIPVHLGAMGAAVRAVQEAHTLAPGDAFVTNDPSAGGSHLPDLTVVAPVHDDEGALQAFVAARGHHADIGGITPGSMPAFSRSLDEEGVVFRGLRVVRSGALDRGLLEDTLCPAHLPARRPTQNIADLEAQLAACRTGADLLAELAGRYGWTVVRAYMGHVLDHGEMRVRRRIATMGFDTASFQDVMDDGSSLSVAIRRSGGELEIDFRGSAPAHPGNLNAPKAVTRACVLYVLRTLMEEDTPLNDGCLRPVTLRVPDGSILNPPAGAAVAGGNVETSQRIVDVLLGALGACSASQGTMNNLTLGNAAFGYYETIAGGAGAGPTFSGASGVHTHMTNSRITDPEVLESRVPVRLRRFALRVGSGGAGAFRGGEGVIRELEALADLEASLLSERRQRAPFGLAGGEDGSRGVNTLFTKDGARDLGGKATFSMAPGDVLRIETPGGGGFGSETPC
ncbi:MAG: hydantoinase B/oxoprolinase family protein [Myxococcota bacterium]